MANPNDKNDLPKYDAVLVTSFGGPEGPADVMPFLENVLRGKNVPHERMLEVAEHYYHFGGKSPINDQNRRLIAALERELAEHGPKLPVYWGNRNWHPMLADTLLQMKKDGVRHALAFVTSAYSSFSSCRQYREDIAKAREDAGPDAPVVDKIRAFHNHPGFIEAMVDRVRAALAKLPEEGRDAAQLIYTAHSIPYAMARSCDYEVQLRETGRLVAEELGHADWQLVYQSRSGPPSQPWLEPDILDYLRQRDCTRKQLSGGHRSDRLRLRPHGDPLRPRHSGARTLRQVRVADGSCGDSGHAPAVYSNDSGTDRGAHG